MPEQTVQEVSIIPRGMAAGYTLTNNKNHNSIVVNINININTNENTTIANDTYKKAIVKLLPEKKNTEVESILKSIEENITIWRIEISEYNN